MTDTPPSPPPSPAALPLRIAVVGDDAGARLDRFIKKRYPKLPIGVVFKLLRKRRITVDGKRAAASTRLGGGQTVEIRQHLEGYALPAGEHLRKAARRRASGHFRKNFDVLFEDASLVVLNKPAGLVVHPGPRHHIGDTLLDLLKAHLPEAFTEDTPFRPAFVHRLDRGTSGVIVAAKSRDAARTLEAAFAGQLTRKVYLALASGALRRRDGRIDYPLRHIEARGGVHLLVAVTDRDKRRQLSGKMQAARTHYRVRERFAGATLVEVETATGRMHQIRSHLRAIGHPLVGDGDYGDRRINRRFRNEYGLEHILLHAARLELPHPESGERVVFEAPLPPEARRLLERLRGSV